MRIFYIIFTFISVFSLYPKIIPIFLSFDSDDPSISDESSFAIVKNDKKINKKALPVSNAVFSSDNSYKKSLKYKNGEYKGDIADAYYGYVQVKIIVEGNKVSDIKFLKFPNSNRNSMYLSSKALPYLKQEAIQAQNGKVDVVSGATYTSRAFIRSAKSAFLKALN